MYTGFSFEGWSEDDSDIYMLEYGGDGSAAWGEIGTLNINNKQKKSLKEFRSDIFNGTTFYGVSPDRTKFALLSTVTDENVVKLLNNDIKILNIDTLEDIFVIDEKKQANISEEEWLKVFTRDIIWSPDSKKIGYLFWPYNEEENVNIQDLGIYIYNFDNDKKEKVLDEKNLVNSDEGIVHLLGFLPNGLTYSIVKDHNKGSEEVFYYYDFSTQEKRIIGKNRSDAYGYSAFEFIDYFR